MVAPLRPTPQVRESAAGDVRCPCWKTCYRMPRRFVCINATEVEAVCRAIRSGVDLLHGGYSTAVPGWRPSSPSRRFAHWPRSVKKQQPGTSFGRQSVTEDRPAQSFILRYEPWMTPRTVLGVAHRGVSFSGDRDRPGVMLRSNFCRISFASSRARTGSPATSFRWTNASASPQTCAYECKAGRSSPRKFSHRRLRGYRQAYRGL
jgi:hypothetical protein